MIVVVAFCCLTETKRVFRISFRNMKHLQSLMLSSLPLYIALNSAGNPHNFCLNLVLLSEFLMVMLKVDRTTLLRISVAVHYPFPVKQSFVRYNYARLRKIVEVKRNSRSVYILFVLKGRTFLILPKTVISLLIFTAKF